MLYLGFLFLPTLAIISAIENPLSVVLYGFVFLSLSLIHQFVRASEKLDFGVSRISCFSIPERILKSKN